MEEPSHLGIQTYWKWASSLNWGILFLEPDLTVHLGNELAAGLLGTSFSEDRSVALCECLSPRSEEYQILKQMMVFHRELRNSLVLWETDGRVRHVLLDSYCQSTPDGTVTGMHVVAKDLGNLMTTEQQLQRNDRLLTVGKVAAGVAHEIRNPLTTIKGFVQVLETYFGQQQVHSTAERTYLDMILSEIARVEFIVSDMLMLANPRELHKTPCSFENLFENLRPFIQQRIESQNTNINIAISLNSLPKVYVDREMLTHAVMNIIANALDAMAENRDAEDHINTLDVRGRVVQDFVQIDISDTGQGIPYYQTDKIFDPFFTTKDAGIGLGLPICQRIIVDHGGEIRVSSKGFGTTFHILLPLYSAESEEAVQLSGR